MEVTVQQNNRTFNVIMAIVVAFLMLCAVMAWHDTDYCTTVTESTIMKWTSDTSWVKEGWK